MTDQAPDIGPETGKRPDTAKPGDQKLGKIGTGQGYSGQEYDSVGQEEWRRKQEERTAPADGAVHGSGAGAGSGDASEDYDVGTPGGAAPEGQE